MSILLKNVELGRSRKDIYIQDNIISEISKTINTEADHKLDCRNMAALPGLYNSHTHAAMTLFRGYADDMPLIEWLTKKIWPNEARLTEKEVYIGTRLACLEMIKSGTIFFNDMYWHLPGSFRAVSEMGIKAALSSVLIDNTGTSNTEEQKNKVKSEFSQFANKNKNIIFALGPHAPYTVSEELLIWCSEFAENNKLPIHIHLSETEKEVKDCISAKKMRPVEYLDNIGFLSSNVIAAHAVWLNEKEIDILAKNNVTVATNPVSNMKLAVGRGFDHSMMSQKGVNITLGTDGTASNNNLDIFEEMKFSALLHKFTSNNPAASTAQDIFRTATINSAKAFGINGGIIEEGKLADIILVDLKRPELVPSHNLISNIVYSANGSCVNTTICNGKILMHDRKVENEMEILESAEKIKEEFFE